MMRTALDGKSCWKMIESLYTLFGQCNFVLSPEENYSNIENCHS